MKTISKNKELNKFIKNTETSLGDLDVKFIYLHNKHKRLCDDYDQFKNTYYEKEKKLTDTISNFHSWTGFFFGISSISIIILFYLVLAL